MQRRRAFQMALVLLASLRATPGFAQQPVCRPAGPDENVITLCRPLSMMPAVRLLSDFTVDHLFKPSPPSFERTVIQLVQPVLAKEMKDNAPLTDSLGKLAVLRFTQLDRTTGTVTGDFDKATREFQSPLEGVDGAPTVAVRFPEHLEGGYWRSPDALQIAFWERRRLGVRLQWENGPGIDANVECLSLSTDGLLLRFAPADVTPVLVTFQECPK